MLSYSAKKQGNNLVDITKITPTMNATATAGEFRVNVYGEWFYFVDGENTALYEGIHQIVDGTVVKRNDDETIMAAFNQAIALDLKEIKIYAVQEPPEPPVSAETQEQIVNAVSEKIILQPIVQPIQTQGAEAPIVWASETINPQFEEVATYAETWTWQNIAQSIITKGVKVYNDNIPESEVRPREYVVISVDDEVRDINFADNRNFNEESFVTLIIQGSGNTFENWVVEISNYIHELLRGFRKKGKIYDIVNRNIGFDNTTNILSRTISFWLKY